MSRNMDEQREETKKGGLLNKVPLEPFSSFAPLFILFQRFSPGQTLQFRLICCVLATRSFLLKSYQLLTSPVNLRPNEILKRKVTSRCVNSASHVVFFSPFGRNSYSRPGRWQPAMSLDQSCVGSAWDANEFAVVSEGKTHKFLL